MSALDQFRQALPHLQRADDATVIRYLHRNYAPQEDFGDFAQAFGYTPPAPPVDDPGWRSVSDSALALGQGVVTGIKGLTDLAGADNPVSQALGSANETMSGMLSAFRQNELQQRAQKIKEAEESGSTLNEVGAYLGGFAEAPLDTTLQAVGTMVPNIAAMMIPGVRESRIAALAAGGAVGAAQGTGFVKGGIYESVKQRAIEEGRSPEEVEALAVEAQRYGGENAGQMALGAGLGAGAALGPVERIASGMARRTATQGMLRAPEKLLPRVALGAGAEAIPEGLQGGQQKLAENLAQDRAGFETDPMRGVLGSAALEAAAAAGLGGAVSLPKPAAQPSTAKTLQNIADAPDAGTAITAFMEGFNAELGKKRKKVEDGKSLLPDDVRSEIDGLIQTAASASSPLAIRREAQARIDELLGEYIDLPTGEATELQPDQTIVMPTEAGRGRTPEQIAREGRDQIAAEQEAILRRFPLPTGDATELIPTGDAMEVPSIPAGEATEALPVGDATEVEPIPVGDAAEAIPAGEAFETLPVGEATEAIPTGEATELPKRIPTGTATELTPEVIEPASELKTRDGMPYGSLAGAKIRARKEGGVVVPVQGGWVVRVADRVDGQTSTVDGSTDGSPADAEKRSDLPRGKSEFEQRFASLDAPRKRVVLSSVVRSIKDSQVLQRVVQAIPVDVMNVLARQQGTPQGLLDNESVLKNALAVDAKNAVSADIDKAIASVVRAVAGVATELRFAGSGADAISNETRSALDAVERLVSGEVATSASAGAEQTASLGVGNVPVGFGDRGSTPRTLDNRQVSTPTSIGELGTSAVAPTDVPPTLSATEPDINTMSREAYAEARQRQYVKKRGGSVPDKVAASVYGNALRQWDQKHPPTPAPQGWEVRTPADVSPAAPAIDTSPQRVEAPAEDQQKPMGFRQAEREAKRLTDETGNPHKAVQRERVDEEGYTVSEWYAEPVEAKRGMSLEEAKAYQEQANRERPLGRTWEDLERMQGGAALNAEDKAAILKAAAAYRKEGMKADEAGRKAVDERIVAVQGMLADRERAVAEGVKDTEPTPGVKDQGQTGGIRAEDVREGATHVDPGEAPEAATQAVVTEAIKTAAENRDRKPSEMRAELLAMVDEAIKEAPDYGDFQEAVKAFGEKDAIAVFTSEAKRGAMGDKYAPRDYSRRKRTFKIPGDGTFTVNNTVRQLLKFRKLASGAFAVKTMPAPEGATDALDRRGPAAAITNMIDEGDPQAAVDYAAARGLDIAEVLKGDKTRLGKIAGLTPTAEAVGEFEPEEAESAQPAPSSATTDAQQAAPSEAEAEGAEGKPGKAPATVENFGEELPPARRNMAAKLTEDLADDEIAKRPLSEIWPLAENEAIEDTFAAAVAHAARAEIPAKPRQPYKLREWVKKVKTLRGVAGRIVSGEVTRDRMGGLIDTQFRTLRDWWTKVQLLERVSRDQWKRIGAVEERPDSVTYEDGKQVPAPMVRIQIDGKSHWLTGDEGSNDNDRGTVDGNIARITALLGAEAEAKLMQFEVRGSGPYKVNKKGDPEYRALATFATTKEAFDFIRDNYGELAAAWEQVKARDNITERDLRSADNRPRSGKDHRQGRDVTADEFQRTFGFRGGEFGKWVKQGKGDKERQALLNGTYDALMDLADLLNVPPRAMSLNGTLGIALGSRGSGWASAHFEPSNLVINLTKTRGAGTLAHEWFHALDNYFSRLRRDGDEAKFTGDKTKYRNENYITHQPEALMVRKDRSRNFQPMTASALKARHEARQQRGHIGWPPADAYAPENWERDPSVKTDVRPEVEERFAELVKALNDSPMTKRSRLLDKGSSGYWGSTLERAARAFESYVIAKMHEQGYQNDFLANVNNPEETSKSTERYPYLLAGEVKPIAEAFDALFGEVKTRTDDAGNVAMFRRAPDTEAFRKWFGGSKVVDENGEPLVVYHGTSADFSAFDPEAEPQTYESDRGKFFFASSPESASGYAESGGGGANVMPVYLALRNPLVESTDLNPHDWWDRQPGYYWDIAVVDGGHDGLIVRGLDGEALYVATRPEQIKSATGNRGTYDPADPDIRMRRGPQAEAKLTNVQQAVDTITATWANPPEVRVVWDLQDPAVDERIRAEDARQRRGGATGTPLAVYDRGTVYIVASAAQSDMDVARSLFHEGLGHAGLRAAFGDSLKPMLAQMVKTNRAAVEAKAKEYGLDMGNEADALRAAEEVLAELAETRPTSTWVKRAISAIRQWLRDNLPGIFGDMELSDADIVARFIMPARNAIVRGKEARGRDAVPRFQRVWHGTPHRGIERFSTDRIGSGEGAQAYGWGLYFASKREVADYYRKGLSAQNRGDTNQWQYLWRDTSLNEHIMSAPSRHPDLEPKDAENAAFLAAEYVRGNREAPSSEKLQASAIGRAIAKEMQGLNRTDGQLYAVEIPEDSEMLLWDKPLSEQSSKVRSAVTDLLTVSKNPDPAYSDEKWLVGFGGASQDQSVGAYASKKEADAAKGGMTGRQLYAALEPSMGPRGASEFLAKRGIRGIKYLDGGSRGAGEGSYNYVVFDGADTEITGTLFRRGGADAGKTAAQDLVNAKGGIFDFNRLGETRQDRVRTVIDGAREFWLGGLTRDQIADVYGEEMPPVRDYDTLTRNMENERQKRAQDADKLYTEWSGLDEATNDKLGRIMLDATVYQVHPDEADPPAKADGKARMIHARIRREYEALPQEARDIYGKVKAFHQQTLADLQAAVEARIDRQVESGQAKAAALTNVRKMFDQYLEGGPYFPLSRFGDYIVIGKREDGEKVVAAYETAGEQQAAARALEADGFTVKTKTAKAYSRQMDGAAGKFIGDVMQAVEKLDMVEATVNGSRSDLKNQLLDDLNQMFIRALPDLSYRKHFLHRKNTPGFSADVMRGFASSAFHAASHIARLNHGDQMTFALSDAYNAIESAPEGDFNKHVQVLNELAKRHDASLNPNTHPLAAALNQVGFVMYLGLSPAAGLVNLLQTPMVTLPHLGARYGFGKATASLGKATKDIMAAPMNKQSGWDATASDKLTADEKKAMAELQDEGIIDLTQAHDLAAASGLDTGNVARSKAAFAMARAMKIVGWTFHVPEVMNRQATALSAYRLEMDASGDVEKAKDAAREAIKRTHFDYSSSNRARYMQGNIARVVLQFKQYAQNMTYLLGRSAQQALQGETPEVRRIARRQLVATLGATWAMAGTLGLPALGAVMGAIGSMVDMLDDDDEPWDWKVEFRNLLADTFGQEAGEVIAHGLPRALMPWDVSGRVGMGELWFRSNDREGQSPREAYATDIANILGPTAGTALGWYTAADHMQRGAYDKAVEAIVPKFLRDPLKAYRESTEGVTTYTGEPVMETTAAEEIGRLLGFAPANVSEMYEAKGAVMNAKTAIEEKRKNLLAEVVKARLAKDADAERQAREEIRAFNKRNPRQAITSETIRRSLRNRRRNRDERDAGILLPESQEYLRERGRFAVTD